MRRIVKLAAIGVSCLTIRHLGTIHEAFSLPPKRVIRSEVETGSNEFVNQLGNASAAPLSRCIGKNLAPFPWIWIRDRLGSVQLHIRLSCIEH